MLNRQFKYDLLIWVDYKGTCYWESYQMYETFSEAYDGSEMLKAKGRKCKIKEISRDDVQCQFTFGS